MMKTYQKVIETCVLTLIIGVIGAYYFVVGYFVKVSGVDLGPHLLLSLDNKIPYTDLFIFFYLYLFIFPPIALIVIILFQGWNMAIIRKIFCAFLTVQLVGFVIFLTVPASAHALITAFPGKEVLFFPNLTAAFNGNVLILENSFPCFHVSYSWILVIAFYALVSDKYKMKRPVGLIMSLVFIFIAISAVTLKYHYLIDLIAGFLLAEIAYVFAIHMNIFHVEQWENCGVKHLLFIEILTLLLVICFFLLSYPNYVTIGHSL